MNVSLTFNSLFHPQRGTKKLIHTHSVSSSTEIFSKRRKIYSLWRKTRVTAVSFPLAYIPRLEPNSCGFQLDLPLAQWDEHNSHFLCNSICKPQHNMSYFCTPNYYTVIKHWECGMIQRYKVYLYISMIFQYSRWLYQWVPTVSWVMPSMLSWRKEMRWGHYRIHWHTHNPSILPADYFGGAILWLLPTHGQNCRGENRVCPTSSGWLASPGGYVNITRLMSMLNSAKWIP